ncbi:hypothetical protein [Actinoplanes couchii]|uniref:Uncharacterized protein n=1 Tax=Actinoplanes couchii TaxID=403638 RepID=A0ABQ3X1R6_9ACTN|nr:hypothetical protein [Actinoplanes couchii]MDR6316730.1 hypothetical protein [Actinoplanes couchii]GID52338.1 hypothetical protein Aco03nite_007420 [Actinoplanes couchii]
MAVVVTLILLSLLVLILAGPLLESVFDRLRLTSSPARDGRPPARPRTARRIIGIIRRGGRG